MLHLFLFQPIQYCSFRRNSRKFDVRQWKLEVSYWIAFFCRSSFARSIEFINTHFTLFSFETKNIHWIFTDRMHSATHIFTVFFLSFWQNWWFTVITFPMIGLTLKWVKVVYKLTGCIDIIFLIDRIRSSVKCIFSFICVKNKELENGRDLTFNVSGTASNLFIHWFIWLGCIECLTNSNRCLVEMPWAAFWYMWTTIDLKMIYG